MDIYLAALPFGPRTIPSLGLSLLKSVLAEAGYSVAVRYMTHDFASVIGEELYDSLGSSSEPDLIGDWIFAAELFENHAAGDAEFEKHVLSRYDEAFVRGALHARDHAANAVTAAANEILRIAPSVVGFTSMFAQHVASLAVAKRVKALAPQTFVVFGGANCENEMGVELVRSFPFVDAVVSGEGESAILTLMHRVLRHERIEDVPGIHTPANTRMNAQPQALRTHTVADLDALPFPDFSDFVAHFGSTPEDREMFTLLVETSRGCWWGAKQHCTFCGLNGAVMQFRSKSPKRVVKELRHLAETYGVTKLGATDNIMDHRYFETLLPQLVEEKLGLALFFEVKANLKKSQVALLEAAGIRAIQPGIESLDDGVLALMRKGVSGLQNVQLLKWCKEFGLVVDWNLLFGFPGELPSAYERMAAVIPLLSHLTPPVAAAAVRLDRFSPNFTNADHFGFTNVRPRPAYGWVYDLPNEALQNLAYYFSCDYADDRCVEDYTADTLAAISSWRDVHERSELVYLELGEALLVIDSRPVAEAPFMVLSGIDRDVFLACDAFTPRHGLLSKLQDIRPDLGRAELEAAVQRLLDGKQMIAEGDRVLTIAVRMTDAMPFPLISEALGAASTLLTNLRTDADGEGIAASEEPVLVPFV
jgi:ribosomal peptide maturation radical SAM protein 1